MVRNWYSDLPLLGCARVVEGEQDCLVGKYFLGNSGLLSSLIPVNVKVNVLLSWGLACLLADLLLDNLTVQGHKAFNRSQSSSNIVIGNSLFLSSCHCIVMLENTHGSLEEPDFILELLGIVLDNI